MRLLLLDADDWMAYEHLSIDFSAVDAVAIGGPNDHGKSAILDALTFCLYGTVARRTSTRSPDQYIRTGADAMFTRVAFDTSDGHRVAVVREKQRGSTAKLRLSIDGTDQTAAESMDATQARIRDVIGLDYGALMASTFMVQHDAGAFMLADPRDRKDLLIALLGLAEYEPLHRAAKKVADRALAERDAARAAIERLALTISAGAAVKVEAAAAVEALAEARGHAAGTAEMLAEAREGFQVAKAERDRIKAVVDRAQSLAAEREALPEQIEGLRRELAEAEAAAAEPEPILRLPDAPPPGAIEDAEVARDDARMMVAEGSRIEVQLAHIRERYAEAEEQRAVVAIVPCGAVGIYAACPLLAAIPTEGELALVGESLARTEQSLADMADKPEEVARWEAERQRLVAMQTVYDRAQNGARIVLNRWRTNTAGAVALANAHRAALRQAEAREAALAAEPEVEVAGEELAAAEAAMAIARTAGDEARRTDDAAKAAVTSAETAWQAAARRVAAVEAAEAQQADEQTTYERADDLWAIHDALAAAWHRDGVPTQIIERAIPMIEAKANEVLSRLPEDLMISLRTQRPKKGKGMAETLDVVVTIDGTEREYGLISWGARLRVDVALRLAMGEVLTHRSGKRIGTLWLDEPLADLDEEGVEAMLEVITDLRQTGDFPLIVVVSHHATFADAFEHRIRVAKADGIATAMLQ